METWYQTKHCLTSGIKEIHDGKYCARNRYIVHGGDGFDLIDKNIFATIEEAHEDQRGRAQRAIAAAEKKIKKLKELL